MQRDSNQVLDFHGNPVNPDFCLLSDGNHHMALNEAVRAFVDSEDALRRVFYVTLPPPALLAILHAGSISLGNLQFPISANLIISPSVVLSKLQRAGACHSPQPFVEIQGYAWLLAKSNPKQFSSIDDLMRDDIRLFISNPQTEKVSYQSYYSALMKMCEGKPLIQSNIEQKIQAGQGVQFGECIHHREAPESIAQGTSDVTLLYHHLALRFSRIFPDRFELLITPELQEINKAIDATENQIQIALIGDGEIWGKRAANFFLSQKVADIYRYHGLTTL